jgi:hypothetical protein
MTSTAEPDPIASRRRSRSRSSHTFVGAHCASDLARIKAGRRVTDTTSEKWLH